MSVSRTTPYLSPNSVSRRRAVGERGAEGVLPVCTGSLRSVRLSTLCVCVCVCVCAISMVLRAHRSTHTFIPADYSLQD